jgi:hypothetical protein
MDARSSNVKKDLKLLKERMEVLSTAGRKKFQRRGSSS